uniref:Uncharacterized protein n=1 Tax=Dunaliella viridis TaxID=140095 RepID=Q0ZBM5_9CHLO|nr:hypothetical protein [Dunaliella viridis]
MAREPGPKRTGPVSSSSSRSRSSGSSTAISVFDSTRNKHVPARVSDQKSLASLLNSFGCGGGCLEDEESGERITSAGDLQPGRRYRGLPALRVEPSVSNVIIISRDRDGEEYRLRFIELTESQLRDLRYLWGLPGLRRHPADEAVLGSVKQLQPGETYYAVPAGESLFLRVEKLEGDERQYKRARELAMLAAIERHAKHKYPGHSVRPLKKQLLLNDKGRSAIDIDAGVVVEGAAQDGGHLLLAGEFKHTASTELVAAVGTELPANISWTGAAGWLTLTARSSGPQQWDGTGACGETGRHGGGPAADPQLRMAMAGPKWQRREPLAARRAGLHARVCFPGETYASHNASAQSDAQDESQELRDELDGVKETKVFMASDSLTVLTASYKERMLRSARLSRVTLLWRSGNSAPSMVLTVFVTRLATSGRAIKECWQTPVGQELKNNIAHTAQKEEARKEGKLRYERKQQESKAGSRGADCMNEPESTNRLKKTPARKTRKHQERGKRSDRSSKTTSEQAHGSPSCEGKYYPLLLPYTRGRRDKQPQPNREHNNPTQPLLNTLHHSLSTRAPPENMSTLLKCSATDATTPDLTVCFCFALQSSLPFGQTEIQINAKFSSG